jgi:predicted AlkP superfamily pyrophosphatase or phosphodiesterase
MQQEGVVSWAQRHEKPKSRYRKLLLILLDGVPYADSRRLFGNLEGWVQSGEARVWKMRAVLPSISASCYASLHTGLSPQLHQVWGNDHVRRLEFPDLFSEIQKAGGLTAAVGHSFWSELFNRSPFDPVRDIEYDEAGEGPISFGRFHSMSGYGQNNQMTPSDVDLFATLTRLCERHAVQYGLLHSCTLDSMGHRFGHDCAEMDQACGLMDAQLAPWISRWRTAGYEVIVTADHGQDGRGHHGGAGGAQQDFAFYYFGDSAMPEADIILDQLALAPSILTRLAVPVPPSMGARSFLLG